MKRFPKFVRLGAKNHPSVFRHTGDGVYWVDAGAWDFEARWVDGKLIAKRHVVAKIEGMECFKATKQEYLEANHRHAFKDI